MSARIAAVSAESAALLSSLHAACFPEPWSALEFAKLLQTPGAFALVVGGAEAPCGLLVGWIAADEAEILTLAVTPDARRRGLARDLVQAAVAEAGRRGARALFLEVAADNTAAKALYAALAFREAGRRRNYYNARSGQAADALVLRLDIAAPAPPLDAIPRSP